MFGTKLLVLTLPFHHLEFYPGCACCSTLLQQAVHGFSRACACTCVPTLAHRRRGTHAPAHVYLRSRTADEVHMRLHMCTYARCSFSSGFRLRRGQFIHS
jgi:hypothetical protein